MLIPLSGDGPLSRRVYAFLRQAILEGRLAPGSRVPASRRLAADHGISRTVVQAAYDQLAAEGYVTGRQGSGTYVAPELPEAAFRAPRAAGGRQHRARPPRFSAYGRRLAQGGAPAPRTQTGIRYDFSAGTPDVGEFPHEVWQRLAARALREASHGDHLYGPPAGDPALRAAVADHLTRTRGMRCTPDRVVVVSGAQQGLDLAARLLLDPGDAVLLEEPHYLGARMVFAAAGARLVTAPVDDAGMDVARAARGAAHARLAYVTPSHQFPTGATMTAARRLALLEWAERHGAHVVEDDYDSEYRYEGRPLESVQALDRSGRVIYVGTFSKVLYPALRIGYVVVPEALVAPFVAAKSVCDRQSPMHVQRVLAAFLAEGHFERHLRRERTRNAARRAALLAALDRELGDRVTIQGENAGMHLVAWLRRPPGGGLDAALRRARDAGVAVQPVGPCYLGHPPGDGIVLGFGPIKPRRIAGGVRALRAALWP